MTSTAEYEFGSVSTNSAGQYQATRLWQGIINDFEMSMPKGRRRHLLRSYDDCFVASDAVTWLHRYLQRHPSFGLGVSRLQALQLLQKLHRAGVFTDVRADKYDAEIFIDSKSRLYRFCSRAQTDSASTANSSWCSQSLRLVHRNTVQCRKSSDKSLLHEGRITVEEWCARHSEWNSENQLVHERIPPTRGRERKVLTPVNAISRFITSDSKPDCTAAGCDTSKHSSAIREPLRTVGNEQHASISSNANSSTQVNPECKPVTVKQSTTDSVLLTVHQSIRCSEAATEPSNDGQVIDEQSNMVHCQQGNQHATDWQSSAGDGCSVETNSGPTTEFGMLSNDMSSEELYEVYTRVFQRSMCQALHVDTLEELLEVGADEISNVIHNITYVRQNGVVGNVSIQDQLPMWLVDALRCLAYWPKNVVENIPDYPNFAQDVYKVICDHFSLLVEPLFTFALYDNIIRVVGYVLEQFDEEYGDESASRADNSVITSSETESDMKTAADVDGVGDAARVCMETSFGVETDEPRTWVLGRSRSHDQLVPAAAAAVQKNDDVGDDDGDECWNTVIPVDAPSLCAGSRRLSQSCSQLAMMNGAVSGEDVVNAKQLASCKSTSVSEISSASEMASQTKSRQTGRRPQPFVRGVRKPSGYSRVRCSYRKAVDANFSFSTPPNRSLFTPSCISLEERNCEDELVTALQYICLLVPPARRRQLQVLLRYLGKISTNLRLVLHEHFTNRQQVLESFSQFILRDESRSTTNRRLTERIVALLIDRPADVTRIPRQFHDELLAELNVVSSSKLRVENEVTKADDHQQQQHCETGQSDGRHQRRHRPSRTASLLRKPLERLKSLRV